MSRVSSSGVGLVQLDNRGEGSVGVGYGGGPVLGGNIVTYHLFLGLWTPADKKMIVDFVQGLGSTSLYGLLHDFADSYGQRCTGNLTVGGTYDVTFDAAAGITTVFDHLTTPRLAITQAVNSNAFALRGVNDYWNYADWMRNTTNTFSVRTRQATSYVYMLHVGSDITLAPTSAQINFCGFHTITDLTIRGRSDSVLTAVTLLPPSSSRSSFNMTSPKDIGCYPMGFDDINLARQFVDGDSSRVAELFNVEASSNGNPPVEAMLTTLTHELFETITDPIPTYPLAWTNMNPKYHGQGEVADNCALLWLNLTTITLLDTTSRSYQTVHNSVVNGKPFLLPSIMDPVTNSCVTGRPPGRGVVGPPGGILYGEGQG
ncbi:hypothetical protein HK104_001892, partial [Borealophlyctis nickersoniae]